MALNSRLVSAFAALLLAACGEPPPPVSVIEFMNSPRLLEAAMVRCGQNRAETKYEAECVNAREAVNRLASAEQQERRQKLEDQSARKRQALRRTQEAAAEARRRALEAQRLREEAEYLGLFEEVTPNPETTEFVHEAASPTATMNNNEVVPVGEPEDKPVTGTVADEASAPMQEASIISDEEELQSDLASIREELQRRRDNPEQ